MTSYSFPSPFSSLSNIPSWKVPSSYKCIPIKVPNCCSILFSSSCSMRQSICLVILFSIMHISSGENRIYSSLIYYFKSMINNDHIILQHLRNIDCPSHRLYPQPFLKTSIAPCSRILAAGYILPLTLHLDSKMIYHKVFSSSTLSLA